MRLLFCLFAEDTGIFERTKFSEFIARNTRENGSDLAPQLAQFFEVLNTLESARLKNLDETLNHFLYVNGKLFEERLPVASFDTEMREALLYCCALDWSEISPAIFGSLFQNIMDETPNARLSLGAHFITEENILKLIRPLFLDELHAEFEKIKNDTKRLPASCKRTWISSTASRSRNSPHRLLRSHCGSPTTKMNALVSEEFGQYFVRLPLKKSAHIVHGNALQLDWQSVLPAAQCSYVMGNPPFRGKKEQIVAQKADVAAIFYRYQECRVAGLCKNK